MKLISSLVDTCRDWSPTDRQRIIAVDRDYPEEKSQHRADEYKWNGKKHHKWSRHQRKGHCAKQPKNTSRADDFPAAWRFVPAEVVKQGDRSHHTNRCHDRRNEEVQRAMFPEEKNRQCANANKKTQNNTPHDLAWSCLPPLPDRYGIFTMAGCFIIKQGQAIQYPPIVAPAVLTIKSLGFRYPDPKVELFAKLSIAISPGVTLVQGGDGRGKSTLLRLLAGALPADAGQLQLNGVSLKEAPDAYRRQLFWVEPRTSDFDQLTPLQYFESQRIQYAGFDAAQAKQLAEGLGLEPHLNKQLFMLSTGSKHKFWLAAAFASGASLLLLDEPFAALDAPSIAFIKQLLRDAAAHPGRAVVIADYEAPEHVGLAGVVDLGD